jgi:hypothetical protein
MAIVADPVAVADHGVTDADIVNARIIDLKIVDGKIIDGRIVGGTIIDGNRPELGTNRARYLDTVRSHSEIVAVIGFGLVLLLVLLIRA